MLVPALAGLAALFLLAGALSAEGGRPGDIFNFGAGARPLGMGGAYAAVSRDVTSLYYNPAGLSMLSARNVSMMHAELFGGAAYDYLGYAQNYGRLAGAWGLQVMKLGIGGVEGRDENNQPAASFGYSETAFAVGTGVRGLVFPFLSAGVSVKMLSRSLADSADNMLGLDIGFQYGPLYAGKLYLGGVLQNFGGISTGDTSDKLPLGYRVGAAYAVLQNVLLCADLTTGGEVRFGTEYVVGPGSLRMGYDRTSFSFGSGLKFLKYYQLDIAVLKHQTLGLSNRVSLGYHFGGGYKAPPKITAKAPDYLKLAEQKLKKSDFTGALDDMTSAIAMDMAVKAGPWGEKRSRLTRIVEGLKLRESDERRRLLRENNAQAAEAAEAVREYVEGHSLKSVLLAHSALGYEPNSVFYGEVLNLLSSLGSVDVRRDEVLPREILVQEKLKKASAAFYYQKFESVLRQCEEVLLLDERNPLAWTRLGSAYFAMGETEKARNAYETAVKYNPADSVTLNFMRLQGWR